MFKSEAGKAWGVRLLPVGARYGRNNCLLVEDELMVEFYDADYAKDGIKNSPLFGMLGQFVSRYYVRTLLGEDGYGRDDRDQGLNLDGGVPSWRLDAGTYRVILAWIREKRDALPAELRTAV